MLRTLGRRLERGHTFSVPHKPTGMIGASVSWCSRAAPQRPFNTGSKKAGPRGIVPCGARATSSPASRAATAACNGSSDPLARCDPDAPHRRGDVADHGGVEDLLLAEEAHRPPAAGDCDRHRAGIEVAAVVHGDDAGPVLRDVVDAVDVEACVGHQLGAGELLENALQLDADHGDLEHAG